MDPIQRYLHAYLARRRLVVALRAAGWVITVAIICCFVASRSAYPRLVDAAAILVATAIIARPLIFIMTRQDPVSVAQEIESRMVEFDQRLITVVSHRDESSMLAELREQVEAVASRSNARLLVSWRPGIAPALAVLAAIAIRAIVHHFESH